MQFVILIVLFGGMMWFMQRNQKKAAAKRQEQLDTMQPGSEIVTIGGLHGILSSVDTAKGTVELDAEGVILTFDRAAVKTVKTPAAADSGVDDVIADAKTDAASAVETADKADSPFE
ncbi:preprotein translocase subunit YajC [Pseudolactococcus insecticola]|uniref:Preprotein translocase subunit YajC n=1 Tax=Pseudolactococcus insecticola TaxID=2709158 RepID=A0A6A0B7P0_9LACT|nr:preprotein translocase subunit YajC [Lactococcus insecticola]GFH40488.1 preprotein translocase subunit YajC [Lactococcus insecticola]